MTQTAQPLLAGSQQPPTVGDRLSAALPGAVSLGVTDRLKMAHDASHYLLTPQAVVAPVDAAQVATVMRVCAELGAPLTFRAGGTSLSGQSVTDSVLVDVRRHFGAIQVLDQGTRVRVGPGAVLRQVNLRLAPYGRRLGPDPASEAACTMGGVIANNSSGMTCGTEHNTYQTLESVVAVLPSGTTVDTGATDADERLRALEPELHAGLLRLRDRVRSDPASVRTVQRQFSLKNTMGYGLNSFLDHDSAVDVLTHLLVGSEGTLAFVAEATFATLPGTPARRHRAAHLRRPPSGHHRPAGDHRDRAGGHRAVRRDVAAGRAGGPAGRRRAARAARRLARRPAGGVAVRRGRRAHRAGGGRAGDAGRAAPWSRPPPPSRDAGARKALWTLRKNLYPAVAGARPSGTTALLEDIAVPPADLATTCDGLATLFARHGYTDNVIFGHAKDGNIHFMLTERFVAGEAPDRFEAFTEDMVELVLGHGGTLKAEHGTGRVMAPYVARQYGDELYDVMCEVKRLFDPGAVLNPGIVVGASPGAHLEHLKILPTVDAEVDRCTECGYCEPVCPSRELTTTPRQRIVLRREQAAAEAAGDTELLARLRADYDYEAVQTCAVDGMCATACPVTINTGDLVKRLRAEAQGRLADRGWRVAATHWGTTLRGAALGLDSAARMPAPLPEKVSRAVRAVAGDEHVPRWDRSLPAGGSTRRPRPADRPDAVYLPSCQSSMFAAEPGADGAHAGVVPAVLALAERAGVALVVPEGIAEHCCGTPWSSKGLTAGYDAMTAKVRPWLVEATDGGRLPVVSDSATCSEGWTRTVAADGIRVVDAVVWVATEVLPTLPEGRRLGSLALHPTCSSVRAGLDVPLRAVAARVAHEVVVPDAWGCCGFAGDRGMLHPELHGLRHQGAGRGGHLAQLRRLRLGQPDLRDRHVQGHRPGVRAAAGAAGTGDARLRAGRPRRAGGSRRLQPQRGEGGEGDLGVLVRAGRRRRRARRCACRRRRGGTPRGCW
jgi:D-lactate dehydrogenase